MELKTALKTRRSIRNYKNITIPDNVLQEILTLANAAPSAGNVQAREFIVIKSTTLKQKLASAAFGQGFIKDAPVVLVVCGNQKRSFASYGGRGRDFYCIQDADAAIMHILLAAHDIGLGTCWVGAFNDLKVSSVLNLPGYIKPIAIIPIGYPDREPSKTSRIYVEKLIHHEKW